jgi:hypothetical protein
LSLQDTTANSNNDAAAIAILFFMMCYLLQNYVFKR